MVEILDGISRKLSGRYPTNWWGEVYIMIGTVLIYNLIWIDYKNILKMLKIYVINKTVTNIV